VGGWGTKCAAKNKVKLFWGPGSDITTCLLKAGVIAYSGAGSVSPKSKGIVGLRYSYCCRIQPGEFGDKIEPDWIRLSASTPPAREVAACNIIVPSLKGQRALEHAMNN